jgi:hypothetical protein
MTDVTDIAPQTSEVSPASTEAPLKVKVARTEAQKSALEKARVRAMAVRAETTALKKKEQEVERALLTQAKAERAAKVEAEYAAIQPPETVADDEETEPPKKARKPRRKIIVHEVSSASDEEDDTVDVVIPKQKSRGPTPEQLARETVLNKMFVLT